jgi:hypothetical protein
VTEAYLQATGRELRPVLTDAGAPDDMPDHRSKEAANENARTIGAMMGQLKGLAGTAKVRG